MEDRGILIVDDNAGTRQLIASLLTTAGLPGCCAESGNEALTLLTGRRFRLMITDWHMPGMDGLNLAIQARKIDPELQIVLATAGIPPARNDLRAAGISHVLLKPFRVKTLLKLIRPPG